MKITLDLPDSTLAGFFNFVYMDDNQYIMHNIKIETKELYDGAEIKPELIPPKEE